MPDTIIKRCGQFPGSNEYSVPAFRWILYILAGFSFGAAMQLKLAARNGTEKPPLKPVLVGLAATSGELPPAPEGTLVIHGEQDGTIPLAAVLDWARPQELPVVLVPGADHFFHRKLHVLRAIVLASPP